MGMVADMILAIAVVAAAAGAIAELQIGIAYIGAATDSALVSVRGLRSGNGCLVRTGIGEGDYLGPLLLGCIALLPEQPTGIGPPGHGHNVQYILAEEQEIVRKGNHGEEIHGEGINQQSVDYQQQIN